MSTGIPYVNETCNAVLGCSRCSPACDNCWAIGTIEGLFRKLRYEKYETLTSNGEWTGEVRIDWDAFKKCLTKTPKTFLLSSLGEWLHESLPIETCRALLGYMETFPYHRFYTLTKRPKRWKELGPIPPNVWLGASVWDQASYSTTRKMIRDLSLTVDTWLSVEPMLGPIKFQPGIQPKWIVVGCESGKNRRPCNIEWVRSIKDQCKAYHIPLFIKQIDHDGKVLERKKNHLFPAEWPKDLRVQEFPK